MFWPEEVVRCIRRKWLSPDRWVPPEQQEHMTSLLRKNVKSSHYFSHPLLVGKECLLFVEAMVVGPEHNVFLPCNQLLGFEKNLWLQRSVTDVTTYSVIVMYQRKINVESLEHIMDPNSCYAPGVVFLRPQGESNIVNCDMQVCDQRIVC